MLTKNTPVDIPGASEANRGPAPARRPFVLWLIVMGLSLLLLPLFLVRQVTQQDNARLEATLGEAQTQLAAVPTLPAAAEQLQATAEAVQALLDQLAPASSTLAAAHVDWPGLLALIANYDDTQVVLTGITQTDNRVVITGHALDDAAVTAYTQALGDSDRFSRVVIQSITRLQVPPAAASPTPAAVLPTVPARADAENTPQPIFLAAPLPLTFETAQTEGAATFLAKANRYYEVSTMRLAPGVDTVLSVSLDGGPAYTNDDVQPGTLASKITFQAPDVNTIVTVRVTNLGQAGPAMSFQLLAQEVVPKSADAIVTLAPDESPAASATPTAAHSATPAAVASPTPTAWPTATQPAAAWDPADGGVAFSILVEAQEPIP